MYSRKIFSRGQIQDGLHYSRYAKTTKLLPMSLSELKVKFVSQTSESKTVRIVKQTNVLFEDIKGFVTAIYDQEWYLACVLETYPDSLEVKLMFWMSRRALL